MQLSTFTRGDGPRTAALVHGATESSTAWLRFADILVETYDLRLILVDQRGHGTSPRADSYHLGDFAGDLVETLPSGLDFLFGQSLGGRATAMASPLLKPSRYIGVDPAFSLPWYFGPTMKLVSRLQTALPRRVQRNSGIKRNGAESIDRQLANWDAFDRRIIAPLVREANRPTFAPQAPAVPSTLVLAEKSMVVPPPRAAEFAALGWDVRVLPGAPHDMHIHDPAALARVLDDVLRDPIQA